MEDLCKTNSNSSQAWEELSVMTTSITLPYASLMLMVEYGVLILREEAGRHGML